MLKYSFSLMALILGISSQVLGMDPYGDDASHMRSAYAYNPTETDHLWQQEQERIRQEQMHQQELNRMLREQENERLHQQELDRMLREQENERLHQQELDRILREQENERLHQQELNRMLREQEEERMRQQERDRAWHEYQTMRGYPS